MEAETGHRRRRQTTVRGQIKADIWLQTGRVLQIRLQGQVWNRRGQVFELAAERPAVGWQGRQQSFTREKAGLAVRHMSIAGVPIAPTYGMCSGVTYKLKPQVL